MSELAFILSDFFAPLVREADRPEAISTSPAQQAQSAAAPPRLPALETLLARAQRSALAAGWRAWLAARTGEAPRAPAELVADAWGYAAAGGLWLATPVALFAGLDSVHVHPAGLLQLEESEQRVLVEEFARVFADSPWRLHALGERELLLSGPPLNASGADPAKVLGAEPTLAMPSGPDAAVLRRLGSEIELWLHEHPLNEKRQQRGELPITTLWLWGAYTDGPARARAGATPARAARVLPQLYGRDTYADALWRLHGADSAPLPADAVTVAGTLFDGGHDSIVLYPLGGVVGLAEALQQFEQSWLAAALTALRERRLRQLWLLTGAYAYRLRRVDLLRIWRASEPWWQRLS